MDIKKVRITRRQVIIDWTTAEGNFGLKLKDAPLPAFIKSVEALGTLVLDILHLPTDYVHGLKTTGLTLVEKQDSQMVVVVAQKELTDCNSPFNIATPLRFLDTPKEEGSYSPPLSVSQVLLIEEVIKQAKQYVKGERAQGQLPLETAKSDLKDDEDSEEDKDELLPFDGKQPANAPKEEKPAKAKKQGAIRTRKAK